MVQVHHRPFSSKRNVVKRRSGGMADALRSGRSVLWGVRVQIPPSAVPQVDKATYYGERELKGRGLGTWCGFEVEKALVAQMDRA